MDYQDELEISKEFREKVEKTFKRIKKKRPKKLDEIFQEAHEKAFEKIDCLSCGNCCKTTSPIFRDVDVKRIAKKFKTSTREFENQYLKRDDDGDLVLKEAPCAFLEQDNSCFIYDVRPQACREYPHTDRKKVVQVLDLTLRNLEICPAVKLTVEEVVKEFV